MEIRLDGRRALITGGSRGLGRAMALRFAAAGADVALVARDEQVLEATRKEVENSGDGRVAAISADVRSDAEIERAWQSAVDALGPIDILVNNAGTSHARPFESLTDADFQDDLDLKLFAAIRFCRRATPGMVERGWGRVINVLATAAKAPPAGGAPTAVSRAAGMALTKILAGELAAHNVLVNALCTGSIVSHQWERQHQRLASDQSFEDFVANVGRRIPVGRMGDPEEFANLACFLASDAASYITGTAINVDGGASPVV